MNAADRNGFVGIFDSGVGGLSVWREVARQLPRERTLYVADQAHVPYGARSLAEVRGFSECIARYLLGCGIKVIVVACNTASAAALHHLRRVFPEVSFVGMEPAVKPAIERTESGVVGVIATQATFQGDLFASLIERYAGDVRVIARACPGLVEAVEAGCVDTAETTDLMQACLAPLAAEGIDQLVLGCTHYPFLEPVIRRVVGPGVTIIDPAPAVARQTGRVLAEQGLEAIDRGDGPLRGPRHVFRTTGDVPAFAAMVKRLVGDTSQGEDIVVDAALWRAGQVVSGPHRSVCKGEGNADRNR